MRSMAWQPLVFFYKRSKRPFYFPKAKPRFLRFSGQAFAFDYNFIGRFFYVLLEVGLKNQAVYRAPDFLKTEAALFSGSKLPYLQGDFFLYRPSYLFFTLFSQGAPLGRFPISFYNSIFLNAGFSKNSFAQQGLWSKRALFKSTMQRVLVAVDSHLSLFFSGKAIFFPKSTNYMATFKYGMGQVYLISGDHNVSFYTWRAEGSASKFGAVSFRRYRDFFFENFFKELQFFFLKNLFSLTQRITARSSALVDFYFGYFYWIICGIFQYLCYLKLLVGSFIFFFFHCFLSFKIFLAELFYLVALFAKSVLPTASSIFYLLFKLSFFRKFFFVVVRSFFLSETFRGMAATSFFFRSPRKALLAGDLAFFKGLWLHAKFANSLYREATFKGLLLEEESFSSEVGRLLPCWVDFLGEGHQKKRKRWIDYVYRYYHKKKKRALFARFFKRPVRRAFPSYIYALYKAPVPETELDTDAASAQELALSSMVASIDKCFLRSLKIYGRRLFPFFPWGNSYSNYRSHLRRNYGSYFFDYESNLPRRAFRGKLTAPQSAIAIEGPLNNSLAADADEDLALEVPQPFPRKPQLRALNPQVFRPPLCSFPS